MSEKKAANMVLSRTRRNQIYLPYARKKLYFDAIAKGDDEAIATLSQKNYEYPTALYNRCGSYSEALNIIGEYVNITDAEHVREFRPSVVKKIKETKVAEPSDKPKQHKSQEKGR